MLTEKLHLQSNELHGLSILDDGRTQVSGIAINPGKYHGLIRIEEDEMQNAVDNLLGDIILKDHDNTYTLTASKEALKAMKDLIKKNI